MRDATDARILTSRVGRARISEGIVVGVTAYLGR